MNNLIPHTFEGAEVRAVVIDGEPWFVGKDVAGALGYANEADAMSRHCKGVVKRYPLPTGGGVQELRVLSEPDVLRLIMSSTLPAAERFERWVFDEVLPTIRRTGGYGVPTGMLTPLKATAEAAKAFPALMRAARLLGCDKNAAAIAANQAIRGMTTIDLMGALGHTHLVAEQQVQFFTPTELGRLCHPNETARVINLLLAEAGMQARRGDVWEVSEEGQAFARVYDTGKRHGSGVPVTQVKWAASVLPLLGERKEPA